MTKEVMVFEKKGEAFITSDIIARETGNDYRSVQRLIETYKNQFESFGQVRFEITPVKNKRGTNNKHVYSLNEQQATFLLTLLKNSEKIVAFKLKLVQEFYKMRIFLQEKASQNWKQARLDGKIYRRTFTDAVQLFVSYCEENGSKSAHRYYSNFTKMLNSLVGCENRENANGIQLQQLSFLESILAQVIALNIAQNTEYHEIYTQCKVKAQSIISVSSVQLLKG